jgi:glutamate dehydrogenase
MSVDTVDAAALEHRLAMAVRSWPEGISDELCETHSVDEAEHLASVWAEAFPDNYRVDYEITDALEDIGRFEASAVVRAGASPGAQARPELHVYLPKTPASSCT